MVVHLKGACHQTIVLEAEIKATSRVGKGREGRLQTTLEELCPVNLYNLMTTTGEQGRSQLCPVNRCERETT